MALINVKIASLGVSMMELSWQPNA